jgi:hypothetical protein
MRRRKQKTSNAQRSTSNDELKTSCHPLFSQFEIGRSALGVQRLPRLEREALVSFFVDPLCYYRRIPGDDDIRGHAFGDHGAGGDD